MIRTNYIHEFDLFDDVIEAIQMNESYVDKLVRDYDNKCNEIKITYMMESGDVDHEYFTEGVVEVVEKIGETVEKVIKKFLELLDMVANKFREYIWNRKSDAQKLEVIIKKHPNLANDIKFAVTSGDLDVKDIKSLHDVMDGTYDILKKLDKGQIEPSKAEKAFDNLITKWNKVGKPIIEIIGGVGTIVTVTKAVSSLYPELLKNKLDVAKIKPTVDAWQAELDKDRKEIKAMKKEENGKRLEIVRQKSKIINKSISFISDKVKKHESLINKVGSLFKRAESIEERYDKAMKHAERFDHISNAAKDKREERISQARTDYSQKVKDDAEARKEDKNRKSKREKDKEERDKAYNQAMGRAAAERKQRNIKKELRDAENKAYRSELGRRRAAEQSELYKSRRLINHEDRVNYRKAYDQEIARLDARADRDFENNNQ